MEENKNIGVPFVPEDNPHIKFDEPHFKIGEFDGQKVIIVGAGAPSGKETLDAAIKMAEENGTGIIVSDVEKHLKNIDLDKDLALPFLKKMSEFPLPIIHDPNTPNKLQLLIDLKLSAEQIDYFLNAPPQRLEGESQEDYKTRRMLNKLLVKYRGQF